MIVTRRGGRTIIAGIILAFFAMCVAGCGSGSSNSQSSVDDAGDDAAKGLAVDAFVFVATQALEEECSKGDATACKIAFAVDPDYKNQLTQEEVNKKLAAMKQQLDDIENELSAIDDLLVRLAQQLNIAVADLKLDSAKAKAADYMRLIQAAFDALQVTDFSDAKVDPKLYVSSAMTNATSSNPWDVPSNLEQLHLLIVDPTEQGLFTKLGELLATKWQGGPPSYQDAINTYELMEQYFGYLLTEQGKGLTVVAACYNYLSLYPDEGISKSLIYKDFDSYLKNSYQPKMEQQIQVFLQHVEGYIAAVADVDRPGEDSSTANNDIKSWTSVVLRRADLMAAWARAGLKEAGSAASGTPALLAVRVIGEPDRSMLLYNGGAINDGTTGTQYVIDKSLQPGSIVAMADYRQWTARGPYMQFPVHLEAAAGTTLREGAIKGASSLYMMKYVLTDSELQSPVQKGGRTIKLPDWIGDGEMTVDLVGTDGNPAAAGQPAMYYGHATLVLKEAAARRGIWSHGDPGNISNDNIDNLTHTAKGKNSFPQSIQLYLYADPHATSKNHCDPSGGGCWTQYNIYGDGHYNVQLRGAYHFEGWGDVPASKIQSMLTGATTHSVSLPAKNGSYSLELLSSIFVGGATYSSSVSTDQGQVRLSVDSADKLSAGEITFIVEPRIKVRWDKSRTSGSFGTCTFQGTTTFDLGGLVLHVK